MIRLIILALGVFVIWVLFVSEFDRRRKVLITIAAVFVAALGLWFGQASQAPRTGIVSTADIVTCGVNVSHSYRSNFDIDFCLENRSADGTVKRLGLEFQASSCIQPECEKVQSVTKEIPVDIAPGTRLQRVENLRFDAVDPQADVIWSVQPVLIKAVR